MANYIYFKIVSGANLVFEYMRLSESSMSVGVVFGAGGRGGLIAALPGKDGGDAAPIPAYRPLSALCCRLHTAWLC
jgi:hypothetical protein